MGRLPPRLVGFFELYLGLARGWISLFAARWQRWRKKTDVPGSLRERLRQKDLATAARQKPCPRPDCAHDWWSVLGVGRCDHLDLGLQLAAMNERSEVRRRPVLARMECPIRSKKRGRRRQDLVRLRGLHRPTVHNRRVRD